VVQSNVTSYAILLLPLLVLLYRFPRADA